MLTANGLLLELTRRGVCLNILNGNIRYSAPENALTPELRTDLIQHKPEILTLYSGCLIPDSLSRIADIWDADIESRGEGDTAWAWIRASDYWQTIAAAENEVNRIGSRGNPEELHAACGEWIRIWVETIGEWRETSQ
jgi:hypothetical protein